MEGGEPGPDRRQQAAPAWAGAHGGSPAAASTPPRIPAGPPAAPREHQLPCQQQLPRLDRLSQPVMIAAAVSLRRQIRLTCTNRPHGHELPLPYQTALDRTGPTAGSAPIDPDVVVGRLIAAAGRRVQPAQT